MEITQQKLVHWIGVSLCVGAVLLTVNYLSGVLLPFFVAWFFAYLLYPIVIFVQHKLKVRVRALAIVITLLLIIGVLAGLTYLVVPPMIDQFERSWNLLSRYISHSVGTNDLTAYVQQWVVENEREIRKYFESEDFSTIVQAVMPRMFSFLGKTASIIISIIGSCITLLYMFFILLDYEYLSNHWIKIFPARQRPFWHDLISDVEKALNSYIRGQVLVATCMGIMFCIGFTIIDFPMALGLGILIGVMDLVPYLHTFALIPTAFLAMMKAADTGQNFWMIFAMALAVFIIVQLITDFITTPKIMGKAMGLNPAILLLSLSVWGALLGFIGLIIALPLTTLLMAYWKRYVTKE